MTSSQHLARAVCLIACFLCSTPALAQTYAEGLRAYDAGDYASARAAWAPRALLGHPEATVGLAQLYLDGLGVDPDPERALALYRSAAEQGYTYAMRKLAVHYLLGEIVPADPATGLAWRLRAARAGDRKAQYEAALQLLDGVGVERDVGAAVGWLREAAEAGIDQARLELAAILVDQDSEFYRPEEAVELYEFLAFKGDVDAQLALAALYWDGADVPRDLTAPRSWAERAAAQGNLMGEALRAAIAFEQERNAQNARALLRATVRLAEQDEVSNAAEAALKRELQAEVSSFLEGLRARGETPCR